MSTIEPNIEEYWDAIEDKVCKHCIDETDGAGNLREVGEEHCALRRFFPEIVKMVRSIRSDDIDDYVIAQRMLICSKCTHQSADGTCKLRQQLDCCLDRYLVLVINTIEEVDALRAQQFRSF